MKFSMEKSNDFFRFTTYQRGIKTITLSSPWELERHPLPIFGEILKFILQKTHWILLG